MKEARKELEQSEERFRLLVDSVVDYAIFMISPDGIIESWNSGAERMQGCPAAEAIGKHFSIFYPEHERDTKPARDLQVAATEGRYDDEGWRVRKDGAQFWASLVITPILDARKTLLGYSMITRDLTERRDAEELLRQSEERANLMIGCVRDYAIFMLSPEGIVKTWNLGASRMKGYAPHEIIGKHFSIFYPEDEKNTKPPHELEIAKKTGRYEDEGWRVRKDGTQFWANVVINAIYDAHDRLVGFSKVTRDLTERRAAEEALRQSEYHAELLISNVRDYAIFMLSLEGVIQTWNLGAERLKGYTAAEIIGKHFSIFYPEHEKHTKPARELEIATKEGRYEEEGWRIRKDGTQFWANVLITAVYDGQGSLVGFAKVTRDMTERRKTEEARIKLEQERIARAEAERSNKIKDEFLAVLSHELRTPLMPIVGWSKILQDPRIQGHDQARGLKIIEKSAHTQIKLIEDLLDISAIVSGKITLHSVAVGVAQLIEAAMDIVRPQANAKNIKLHFTLEESVGPINGDPVRLQQIVWNLLTNAVKFTPKDGSIEIRVRRRESFAQLEVTDSGAGIAPDYLPHVFERFSQFDSSSTRKYGGLGIGLYVVQQLVRLHGGSVTVKSQGLGLGTAFTVELPLPTGVPSTEAAYPSGAIDATKNTCLLGKTVLVVDDEPEARDFLTFALRRCGADVVAVESATDALDALNQRQFDILLSDIGMPGTDGYELIRKLRTSGSTLPAIAVTAFARGEDAVRATNLGFQRHLAKPVTPEELCATVANVLQNR